MEKLIAVIAATGVAVLGIGSLAGASSVPRAAPKPKDLKVLAVLGAPAKVPPGKFVKAYAYCPKGYYVTGGGAYSGAIVEIASSPLPSLRGWFIDGTNHDTRGRTFTHRADAVCVKGNPPITVGTAADGSLVQAAERDSASETASNGPHKR